MPTGSTVPDTGFYMGVRKFEDVGFGMSRPQVLLTLLFLLARRRCDRYTRINRLQLGQQTIE
jgi:hypothetical protein